MGKDRNVRIYLRRENTSCRVSSALEGVFSKRAGLESQDNWKAAVEVAKGFKIKDSVRTPDGRLGQVIESRKGGCSPLFSFLINDIIRVYGQKHHYLQHSNVPLLPDD
jgi:hypothetical protein